MRTDTGAREKESNHGAGVKDPGLGIHPEAKRIVCQHFGKYSFGLRAV